MTAASRLLRDLEVLVRAILPELPFYGVYRYRVVTANPGDARWHLQAVSRAPGLPDLAAVRVRPGMAGLRAELVLGSIVHVAFVEGDPAQPCIVGFPSPDEGGWKPDELTLDATDSVTVGESSTEVLLGAGPRLGVARIGDTVQAGPWTGVITGGSSTVKAGA